MKLTVLDGHAANPGDLSWDAFKDFGEVTVYERTPENLVVERIAGSDAVLLNKIRITEEILSQCPKLKYIGVLATGYNVVDLKACSKHGITVTNIPAYSTDSVAQHVFAFILNFTNLVQQHSASVHEGGWMRSPDFCYWNAPLTELSGKTLGIFGFGSIGQRVAQIAKAFKMKVLVCVHNKDSFTGSEESVSFEELLKKSDFLTLHAPLTEETSRIINKKTLKFLKPGAIVINTARGGLVDEKDVFDALSAKTLAGYAADVIQEEPMTSDCPLFNAPNCILTPHIAWAPKETRSRLLQIAYNNVKSFIAGKCENKINI